jgi:hypothetical protein
MGASRENRFDAVTARRRRRRRRPRPRSRSPSCADGNPVSRFHTVRAAREGRFTIHKTTRRIELSPLRAAAQLPVPFATERAARICIIPFASTILIGGLFQSLSLRIFAFALLYLPRPLCPPLPLPLPAANPPRSPFPPLSTSPPRASLAGAYPPPSSLRATGSSLS